MGFSLVVVSGGHRVVLVHGLLIAAASLVAVASPVAAASLVVEHGFLAMRASVVAAPGL